MPRRLSALERAGAELVPIRIAHAAHAAAIGYLTIGIEAFTALSELRARHMDAMGPDLQLFLSGIETFRPDDYLDGQRLRHGLRREVAEVLRHVDLLAPVGSDRDGMPVGLQLIGDAWDEACVLQAVAALERAGVARAVASDSTIDLLA